ncbi:GxxExxY protein [Parasphingorhabdus halotolerans]|uniref:GxxExxY protein n=1 Tax=Parasphingorhabdus halotolerans TaxID=2725558 RepID=A0A6H2DIC2_9SPHN|nr:GxxExxY protein [Parasphingorhabdus halotolerans]QJB67938.1 GxxExxY protein [Parasphingorhabdus halotolerans]
MKDLEEIARIAVNCGFKIHKEFGPGLLESVYEVLLFESLKDQGLSAERQKIIPITFKGKVLEEAFRADIIVEGQLLIELKSTERHAPVHAKQVLTYLRLMNLQLGFLMNFGSYTFKDGIKRLSNDYYAPKRTF